MADPPPTASTIVVLGGGTAGFLSALTFRRRLPGVAVRVVRSRDIGIIGVGEGTTPAVVSHLFNRTRGLGLDVGGFYRAVNPIWKLGIKYLWGPRGSFNYAFGPQLADRLPLARPVGFYVGPAGDGVDLLNRSAALMTRDRAFAPDPATGLPVVDRDVAFHLENAAFVAYLEAAAVAAGTVVVDDTVVGVDRDADGVRRLRLASGRTEVGALFVDCSGFASELLGKALGEPFVSYRRTLFCDRAVVGGWRRGTDEPIRPYTTAQTMDAGWSWRIDHEHFVNRGYVYGSDFLADDAAEAEFRRANPRVGDCRVVRFRSGRFARYMVGNVIGIGNASGFVEPMEATAIAAVCEQASTAALAIANVGRVTPALRDACNDRNARYWDAIPKFLAAHYKFNTLRDTPFWRAVWADCDLAGGEAVLDYYRQCGPDPTFAETLVDRVDQFALASYFMMFVGQNVPHENGVRPSDREAAVLEQWRQQRRLVSATGLTAEAALAVVRDPRWQWRPGAFDD